MRAIQVSRYGGPEVLELVDVPDPKAGPGQVLIDVAVADVLFVDSQIRSGTAGGWFEVALPYVPGNGVGGTVASVGQGVDPSWVGRRVVGRLNGAGQQPSGGYVERAALAAVDVLAVPDGLSVAEAITVLHDGSTALLAFEQAAVKPQEWVLVNAAGGSLGSLLVPMAKAAGARVIGAARGERKLTAVRKWGADAAIDYTDPDWADQVLEVTGGHGVDVVFDGTGGAQGRTAYDLTTAGARVLAYGASSGNFVEVDPADAAAKGVTIFGIMDLGANQDPAELRRSLENLLEDAAAGKVTLHVGQTFPLAEAAAAHAAIQARETVGKTLLTVD